MILNRSDWYSAIYIQLELVKQLKFRYLSARKLDAKGKGYLIRYHMGYSVDMITDSLKKFEILTDKDAKIYFDLTIWKNKEGNLPLFSYNQKEREKDKEDFNENYKKYFKGYDFAIDIDASDVKIAHQDAKKVKAVLDKYKLPYSLKFSGGKGFHFLIDDKWFDRKRVYSRVNKFGKIARIIMNLAGLRSINDEKNKGTFDDSIYDDRRIFKLAYSLQNKDGIEYVCLPLTDEQFDNFNMEMVRLDNVMRNIRIKNRGMLERDFGLTEKELKDNVLRFMKECNSK